MRSWTEFYESLPADALRDQAARCMDCGVPFCQGDSGCPVQNLVPEWNDLVYRGRWHEALDALHATNNFPEFTGRLCPAPCESACVLGLVDAPVAIRHLEEAIIERGFDEGWVTPLVPLRESGRRVAVVGSGPAGLAAAQQLRRVGHEVVVLERADRVGGLLRYGIPDFKIEKRIVDRRIAQMRAEGVVFETGVDVGRTCSVAELRAAYDAVLLAIGATVPRELDVPGRALAGVHFAMEFLEQQNRRVAGDRVDARTAISAADRHVVIIGGGDTGSDCLGTCHRQGAREVWQIELLPQPPASRAASTPWPAWPLQLRSSHAHEEGGRREWSIDTVRLSGRAGRVDRLHAVRVEPVIAENGATTFRPLPDGALELRADLVLLAMGFTGPENDARLTDLGVRRDARGNIATDAAHATGVDGVFAAGDAHRGASLIVWAIREGRDAAASIDRYLRRRTPDRDAAVAFSARPAPRLAAAG